VFDIVDGRRIVSDPGETVEGKMALRRTEQIHGADDIILHVSIALIGYRSYRTCVERSNDLKIISVFFAARPQ
jgi:hypothetical protein